jgi:hypothetical protein
MTIGFVGNVKKRCLNILLFVLYILPFRNMRKNKRHMFGPNGCVVGVINPRKDPIGLVVVFGAFVQPKLFFL